MVLLAIMLNYDSSNTQKQMLICLFVANSAYDKKATNKNNHLHNINNDKGDTNNIHNVTDTCLKYYYYYYYYWEY